MFGWLRRRRKAEIAEGERALATGSPDDVGDIFTAFILLDSSRFPSASAVEDAIRRYIPEFTPPEDSSGSDISPETLAVVGQIGEMTALIGGLDFPNPLSPDESFIQSAWWWPDVHEDLERRKAHIIVSLMQSAPPRHKLLTLARVTAAVVEICPGAIGVIWDKADAVWQAAFFKNEVLSAVDRLPLVVLVSVKVARDGEQSGQNGDTAWLAMTYGLASLGLNEIEVRGFDGQPGDLVSELMSVAQYLVDAGAVLKDGDTLGPSARPEWRVHIGASTLGAKGDVYRLQRVTMH